MSARLGPRLILFSVVAVLAGLLYGNAVTLLPVPWVGTSVVQRRMSPTDLRWDMALTGAATGLMLGAVLLILAWRPWTKPLLVQFIAVAVLADVCLEVPFRGAAYLLLALPAVVVIATYPRPHALVDLRPQQRLRLPFVALGAATGLVLLVRVAVAMRHAVAGVGPSADLVWIDDAVHTTGIAAGVLAAITGRPGWRVLMAVAGGSLCYLGVVSLTLPQARGGWDPVWAIVACAVGVMYVGAAAWPKTVVSGPYPRTSEVPAVLGAADSGTPGLSAHAEVARPRRR